MDIEIVRDQPSLYAITINNKVVIQTVSAEADESTVTEWVREIRKVYAKKKKKKAQTLAIGLSAEHSANYKNGRSWSSKDAPYEIIQICIGNHCLILHTFGKCPFVKALRELLSDNNVIVFGVGIDRAAKKIEKDFGVKLSKPWDLRKLADCAEHLERGYYGKYNLEKLALAVLGKERELVKPNGISWYRPDPFYYHMYLSDEKIKYGTVEAFLAYEMGMIFLEKGTIEAFPEYEKSDKHLLFSL